MIFRRPKSYSITLKRAHSLLNIPKDPTKTSIGGGVARAGAGAAPSRDQIQDAFRSAAKRHHPDLVAKPLGTKVANFEDANRTFRECHDARELLLDHYVRRKFVPPEILESTRDRPVEWEDESFVDSFASVWKSSGRSFRAEAFLRLSACLALAVGCYYHDKYLPEKRRRQIQRRDAQFADFGPSPPRF